MRAFVAAIQFISKAMHWVSGVTIWIIMAITLVDVIMRHFKYPIVGSFEIVSFLGALVVGLAVPYTSLKGGHIYVDFVINKFSRDHRDVMHVTTRIMGMFLFVVLSWFFFSMALDLYSKGEVSTTFKLPFYPIATGLGLSFFIQVLVLAYDAVKTYGGDHE